MEPNQQKGAQKLQLKKHAVSNLSKTEMEHLSGGEEAITTSIQPCTGFLCCDDTTWITLSVVVTIWTSIISIPAADN